VAAAAIEDVEDQFQDPHFKARGFLAEVEEPEMGPVVTEFPPVRLSETPAQLRTPAPLMGEHTDQVLRELLKLDDKEISALKAANVLD
jgi:crotonobetainyl-CoA:carnitine CoA-transferase CaiB-like acyl-CoA transferase